MDNTHPYMQLLEKVFRHGELREDRTGTGTLSIFGEQIKINIDPDCFPAVTTKKLYFKGVVHELLWMLSGSSNIKPMTDHKVNIWNEWADDAGDLGPVYGVQWRRWNGEHDQIKNLILGLRDNPYSRRHIVSAWNVSDLDEMALPPCHAFFQFYVGAQNNKLSCHLYQRSADLFLGVPFNIASYSLLTCLIAQVCGMGVGTLTMSFGDAHVYTNHVNQVQEQLNRNPYPGPRLWIDPNIVDIDDFRPEHIKLLNYQSHPTIKAPISV